MRRLLPLLAGTLLAGALQATPVVPASDATVVETLPARSDPLARELKALRTQATAQPQRLDLALELARRYVDSTRRLADPRYLGYAESVLAPWLARPQPPLDVRVMHAIILQSTHRFDEAITELQRVLARDPAHAQAWLTLASVHQVRGEFEPARAACRHLATLLDPGVAGDCLTGIAAQTGRGEAAYRLLALRQAQAPDWSRSWLTVQLAELAQRLGRPAEAGRWFEQALGDGHADSYLKAAYADFLLDQRDYPAVIGLLADDTRADPLLLRLAEAEAASGRTDAAEHIAALDSRFAAARARGDVTHRREEARFRLRLQRNAPVALQLALDNWQVQREPADVRIVLEAALAAHQPQRAQPVLDWLRATHLEDISLRPLAAQLTRS